MVIPRKRAPNRHEAIETFPLEKAPIGGWIDNRDRRGDVACGGMLGRQVQLRTGDTSGQLALHDDLLPGGKGIRTGKEDDKRDYQRALYEWLRGGAGARH